MKRAAFRYALVFTLSFLALLWERVWNHFWMATSLALLFIALSLLNIPLLFGAIWHWAIWVAFLMAAVVVCVQAALRFSLPSRSDVERRMEQTSSLAHRPLDTLQDIPVEGLSPAALDLWEKHLQRAADYLHQLKIYKPQPDVASRDQWAARYIVVVFLVVGLVVAQEETGSRIRQSLTPDMGSLLNQKTSGLDIWITPPEYTHGSVSFLATATQGIADRTEPLRVPAGSILKLRAAGYRFAPRLRYGDQRYPLTETAPENFTLEMPLQQSGVLSLGAWLTPLGQWPVTVVPDAAPEIAVIQTDATPRAAVKIRYKAHDDYGITKLTGILSSELGDAPFNISSVPVSGEAVHVEDLTAHPAAGLPVTLTLEAEDAAGHKTVSAPHNFLLPERRFTNVVAERLIAERKSLLWNDNILVRRAVAQNIAAIAEQPMLYKGDIVTFLALSTAVRRLIYDDGASVIDTVQDILWNTALKLDDGGLSLAQRDLRDALQKMSEALQDKNMSKQQLQEILDDVQKKMRQYVQALAAELQQRLQQGKKLPVLSPELAQKFMKNIDLGKILEQMKQLSQSNSRENLQKLAENLRNAIDNLDMGKFDQMQEKQMQAMAALQNLEEIIRRQQTLFDQTNKARDAESLAEQKQEQTAIRRQLGESLRTLAETVDPIPENFAKADQAMKLSEQALGKGQPRDSLPAQKTALEELQKGQDEAIKQMAQSMQSSLSLGLTPNSGNMGAGFDPLGRQTSPVDDGSVKLPSEKEQRRVQEIIEELRHRSNEPNRTKVERDYIERLLDRF